MSTISGSHIPMLRSSELSKHSARVFAQAEQQPVTITRRDGESMVLMSQREADARGELLHLAAQLITATLDEGKPLHERMAELFPWILALPHDDRRTCAQDLVDAARASFSTNQPHLAVAELTAWRESATAHASGIAAREVEWLDEPRPVERP